MRPALRKLQADEGNGGGDHESARRTYMLDCRRVNALTLRLPNDPLADFELAPGVHAIGRGSDGRTGLVDDVGDAMAQFCVDRRGVWLQLHDGTRGVHVNGRPIRRMAMLRAGDAIYIDGVELLLLGEPAQAAPAENLEHPTGERTRMVLRGVGGQHHGRCFSLDVARRLGRNAASDIRITEAAFADQHAEIQPYGDGALLRDLGSSAGSLINGHPARDALLRPGDQVVFDAQHRFVVESPNPATGCADLHGQENFDGGFATAAAPEPARASSIRRMPWLLLAALMLSGALSALLLYGAR